jgi:aerobic carbon-monoxide dehydrogenase large subunit
MISARDDVYKKNRLVGASLKRTEDPRFLTGRGNYVDDIRRSGMLHAAFFRSDMPHAILKSVDVTGVKMIEGVVDVFTARDLAPLLKPFVARNELSSFHESEIPILARDKVIFVGQPIAVVIADSRHAAEDGVDAIRAEYEALAPITDVDQAMAREAPLIHNSVPANIYNHFHLTAGDIDQTFADAAFIVDLEVRNGRCAAMPLEPRVLLAEWSSIDTDLNVWISHQAPHLFRTGVCRAMGIPEGSIRVISPDVGGGFGVKLIVYPEDVAIIAAARLIGRPVKWMGDRREDLLTTMHGREQVHHIRSAVTKEGRILGVKVTIKANNGAYSIWPMTAGLDSGQASENVPGPYDLLAYERDVYAIATNKAPMGPYRGVGRVSACFAIERTMDEIARRLKIDPLEIRRRNVVRHYPYETKTGLRFESGSSAETLDRMEDILSLPELRREHDRLRDQGIYRGVGLAAIVEHSALGPKEVGRKGIDIVLGYETALIRLEPDGQITVVVGTHCHGQGHETTFAQIAADEFGVPLAQVRVRFGDTALAPYGMGTWASRSLVYAGGAVILASRDVKDKLKRIAAHLMEKDVGDVIFADGAVGVKNALSEQISIEELARVAYHQSTLLPDDMDPGLEVTRRYRAPDPGSFSNSLHAAVVEVDITTGAVKILRYVVIEDCGTLVNPLIVDGQIIGGVAQGIGQALLEHAAYDQHGQPIAVTLADYLVPLCSDMPRIEIHHIETPSPLSLGGFKGMGEGGAVNPPAAIANAVTDALSPFGIAVNHTPITPEWIVSALAAGASAKREKES